MLRYALYIMLLQNKSMHTATSLPLHHGRAPRWLFSRMVKLSGAISTVIMDESGPDELLRRLSDPYWFQALACAIGYDWHSSGTTTVTMGALKEALNSSGYVYIAGGKGSVGLRTPEGIAEGTDRLSIPNEADPFQEYSRLAAKIDSALVYDGIGIYHHTFIFSRSRKWAVVQQGMLKGTSNTIRFQWFSDQLDDSDIANEPHTSVGSSTRIKTLDLTSGANGWARSGISESLHEYGRMLAHSYPHRHGIAVSVDLSKRAREAIRNANEVNPSDYKELLLLKGMGRATMRSLAFVSSLIFGKDLAYRDPVTYAYNLGGKDGIPFGVDRNTYDSVISSMRQIVDSARVEAGEKYKMLKRLERVMG